MAGKTNESVGGASSAYEVNDSDFEVSDVEGDMTEQERAIKRKEKIKKNRDENGREQAGKPLSRFRYHILSPKTGPVLE